MCNKGKIKPIYTFFLALNIPHFPACQIATYCEWHQFIVIFSKLFISGSVHMPYVPGSTVHITLQLHFNFIIVQKTSVM